MSVADSFRQARQLVDEKNVPRSVARGLELLAVVIAGAKANLRSALAAISAHTRQSTKRNIGRVMRLLSKKFLTRVDDRFLSEHIRVLILKNKITNPSVLNLVRQNDIEIAQEDFAETSSIAKTEALLQVFLALELFLPVDLWVTKLREAHNRTFFRLLRNYAAQREAARKAQALTFLEGVFARQITLEVGRCWELLRETAGARRSTEQTRARAATLLERAIDAARRKRVAQAVAVLQQRLAAAKLSRAVGKSMVTAQRRGFQELFRAGQRRRTGAESHTQTVSEAQVQATDTRESATDMPPTQTTLESFVVLNKKSRGQTGIAVGAKVREADGDSTDREAPRKPVATNSKTSLGDSADRPAPGPQNRYAKNAVVQVSTGSSNATVGVGQSVRVTARAVGFQPGETDAGVPTGFDADAFKQRVKFLERLFGTHRLKNWALGLDRIRAAVTVLEVLEISDLTKDLDPVAVQVAGQSGPRADVDAPRSLQAERTDAADLVFIRKSHFFKPEVQAARYAEVVKPQSALLDRVAEVRREEGSRASFAGRVGGLGVPRTRHFATSMILEHGDLSDPRRRSFVAANPDAKGGQGLRARYK